MIRSQSESRPHSLAQKREGAKFTSLRLGVVARDSNPSGGGRNRTRVPWHFGKCFYVCSLSLFGVFHAAFVSDDSGQQDPPGTIEQVI